MEGKSLMDRLKKIFRRRKRMFVKTDARSLDEQKLSNRLFDVGASIVDDAVIRCEDETIHHAVVQILKGEGLDVETVDHEPQPVMSELEREVVLHQMSVLNDGRRLVEREPGLPRHGGRDV